MGIAMSRWKWALLIFELALFALILALPQVDLPQIAFHSGSAPVTVKAKALQAPHVPVIAVVAVPRVPNFFRKHPVDKLATAVPTHAKAQLALVCVLLC